MKKKSTPGIDYFRVFEADKWSQIDAETGLPTHHKADAKGVCKEVSKEQINGLKKKMKK